MAEDKSTTENFWAAKVVEYREEPAIALAVASARKFKTDLSLIKELSMYFPHLDNGERKLKSIRGRSEEHTSELQSH